MICYSVYRTREILHMFFLQEMIIKIQGVINVIQHKGSCTLVQRCFLFGDNGIEQRSCKSKSWTVRNITLWQQQISPSLSCWCWLPFIEIKSKSLFYKNTANHGSPFKKRFFNCPIKSPGSNFDIWTATWLDWHTQTSLNQRSLDDQHYFGLYDSRC